MQVISKVASKWYWIGLGIALAMAPTLNALADGGSSSD
jgi:hypothetical protein